MLLSRRPEFQNKIRALRTLLEEGMVDNSNVKKWHINQSILTIQRCLKRMDKCNSEKQANRNIARSVISLNFLNWLAKGELIYTMEREDVAEIINEAAILKGLNPMNVDMTEDFRTW